MIILGIVEWLISDDERDKHTGRTALLATAFIRKALKNPGVKVRIFDHYPTEMAKGHLLAIIRAQIAADLRLRKRFTLTQDSITCKKEEEEDADLKPIEPKKVNVKGKEGE